MRMSVQAEAPTSEQTAISGELTYEYTAAFTQVVEYGVSAEELFSGQAAPPAEGARFDVYFEGPVTGRLRGMVKGVDYLHVRADGRCQLNIHAEITTEDGKKISLAADGVAIPADGAPVFQRKENVTLMTTTRSTRG
jgi:hypothetical protein